MKTSTPPVGRFGLTVSSRARLHRAVDADHPFGAHPLGRAEGRRVGVGDALGQAVVVAQVDEQQAAVVAHPMDPAGKAHGLADIGGLEGATGMAAIAVHGRSLGREMVARRAEMPGFRRPRKAHASACLSRPAPLPHPMAPRTPRPRAPPHPANRRVVWPPHRQIWQGGTAPIREKPCMMGTCR